MSTTVVEEVTCRKTGPWVGALGRRLIQKKGINRPGGRNQRTGPDDQDPTGGPDNGTKTSGHKTSPHKRTTTPRATTGRTTRNFYSPFQGFDLKGKCCLGSAPAVLLLPWYLSAARHQPNLAELCSWRWQTQRHFRCSLTVETRVIPHDETRRIDRKRVLEEKRQRSFTRATGLIRS